MSTQSAIEWTDATWNPVRGCVKVSPGCAHCYAETFAERFRGVPGHPYAQGFDLRLVPEKLAEPLSWKKPRRVFVNSMSDLFQDGVPDDYIDAVWGTMVNCPQHTFQILTKRPERMLAYFKGVIDGAARDIGQNLRYVPAANVWLGVSVENQHFADQRIPLLLQTPAAVRFISAEPLLESVNLSRWLRVQGGGAGHCFSIDNEWWHEPGTCTGPICLGQCCGRGLDWVIVGGESGHGARPLDVAWGRSIVGQCQAAGVPVFVKQLGANARWDGAPLVAYDLKDRKGGNPDEWPADLRVREYPR